MAKDTHKILRKLADRLIEDCTDENCSNLLNEIIRILMRNEDVIIDGVPVPASMDQVEPTALTAGDGRAYLNIYTDHDRFVACGGKAPYVTNLHGLLNSVFQQDTLGGISLNYKKGEAVVLVGKEQIFDALQEYVNAKEEEEHGKN